MRTGIRIFFCVIVILYVEGLKSVDAQRIYTEIIISPNSEIDKSKDPHAGIPGFLSSNTGSPSDMPEGMVGPGLDVSLTWELPEGWSAKPASGMRLATFTAGEGESAIECSIVSLGGAAGSMEANVNRWLLQIQPTLHSEKVMKKFMSELKKITTKGGHPATVIDFTQLRISGEPQEPSMMATIIELEGKTLFVKMRGPIKAVFQNQRKFKFLSQSIAVDE